MLARLGTGSVQTWVRSESAATTFDTDIWYALLRDILIALSPTRGVQISEQQACSLSHTLTGKVGKDFTTFQPSCPNPQTVMRWQQTVFYRRFPSKKLNICSQVLSL